MRYSGHWTWNQIPELKSNSHLRTLQCIVGRTCHGGDVDDDASPSAGGHAHVVQSQVGDLD